MDEVPPCAGFREFIPELAAGAAAGDERARALRHLAGCAGCRRELAGAAGVIDELLALAPGKEPPPGFADTVLDRLTETSEDSGRPP